MSKDGFVEVVCSCVGAVGRGGQGGLFKDTVFCCRCKHTAGTAGLSEVAAAGTWLLQGLLSAVCLMTLVAMALHGCDGGSTEELFSAPWGKAEEQR